VNGRSEFRRAVRVLPPLVHETPPTATIACGDKCCGNPEDCKCGECREDCGSPLGTPKAKKSVKFVDYSGMIGKNILRLVDYNSVSEMSEKVATSMR
jgi:hypothetical protein